MFLKNKIIANIALLFVLSFLIQCKNKDLELEVIETACSEFFIDNAIYSFSKDSDCGDEQISMSFDFDGDNDCIHLVKIKPRFYDINRNELNQFDTSEQLISVDNISVSGNTISLDYCFNYQTASDTADLNYLQIDFHTENEQGNESNEIGIRANIPGAPVKQPTSTDFQKEFEVQSRTISLFIFDDAAEDGDIISVNVNNKWEIENKMIFKNGEKIELTIQEAATNFLLFYAVNEGASSPNTLAGKINDGITEQPFDLNLKTGEVAYFKITFDNPSN